MGDRMNLTMNFPQHNSTKIDHPESLSNDHRVGNSHDPQTCLDCVSSMFASANTPFSAFLSEFIEYAKTQNAIILKQNDLLKLHWLPRKKSSTDQQDEFNENELEHVFTFGKWSNGKNLISLNPQRFLKHRRSTLLIVSSSTIILLLIGVFLGSISFYLATMKDATDPVLAFIRAYSRRNDDEFHYFTIILGLTGISSVYISSVICYLFGIFGHSAIITLIALIVNGIGILSSIIIIALALFMSDRFNANLSNILQSNVDTFESDSSADSMSFSWTLMHRKFKCCLDGIIQSGQTVAQKSPIFASLHVGWSVPVSCCSTGDAACVVTPTLNNSFIAVSCIPSASNHFEKLLTSSKIVAGFILIFSMISALSGVIYWMNLKTARHRMKIFNNELAKSLFTLKSSHLAGLKGKLIKPTRDSSIGSDQNFKKNYLKIPGYLPITPTILQVRQPEKNTYLHYGL